MKWRNVLGLSILVLVMAFLISPGQRLWISLAGISIVGGFLLDSHLRLIEARARSTGADLSGRSLLFYCCWIALAAGITIGDFKGLHWWSLAAGAANLVLFLAAVYAARELHTEKTKDSRHLPAAN